MEYSFVKIRFLVFSASVNYLELHLLDFCRRVLSYLPESIYNGIWNKVKKLINQEDTR